MRKWLTFALSVAGLVAVVVGVAMWSAALAWVAAGALMMVVSVIQAPRTKPAPLQPRPFERVNP